MISKNQRTIDFTYQFATPGEHTLAIGNTPNKSVTIHGKTLKVLYSDLMSSLSSVPEGETIIVSAKMHHVGEKRFEQKSIYL